MTHSKRNDNKETEVKDEPVLLSIGRNAVREALKSGQSIECIYVAQGELEGSIRETVRLAKEKGCKIVSVRREKLDEMALPYGHSDRPGNHQGIIAMISATNYVDFEAEAEKIRDKSPFILMLNNVTDVHNIGAILRSAECCRVDLVVLPKRRSAPINAAVARASSGALHYLKIARVPNLSGAIEWLKKTGYWVMGADMRGESLFKADLTGPLALVIGAEGEGLSRLVREKCDKLISIPMRGKIESLNVSVAAGVIMVERVRQTILP